MEKLARLREERKKLEVIETQVLGGGIEDPHALHAWAARELKQLSNAIRATKIGQEEPVEYVQLKTSRPKRVEETNRLSEYTVRTPVSTDSLEEIPVARSEARILDSTESEEKIEAIEEIIIPPSTVRENVIAPEVSELSLCSLTPSVSVSLQDEFSESMRSSSPEPLTERRIFHINEILPPKEVCHDPDQVLEAFVQRKSKEERLKREDLGNFAKSVLRKNDAEKIPPLVSKIDKKTKSGIAFSFDPRQVGS
jgi:hypothetical protein